MQIAKEGETQVMRSLTEESGSHLMVLKTSGRKVNPGGLGRRTRSSVMEAGRPAQGR